MINPLWLLAVGSKRVFRGLKAAASVMLHGGYGSQWQTDRMPNSKIDFKKEVAGGARSSVVMGPVQWITRKYPEAPLCLIDQKDELIKDHAMLDLVERPNEFYDGDVLMMGTLISYVTAGNAYWLKIRDGLGRPVALWYVPHWKISPAWPSDGQTFISKYIYKPSAKPIEVPVEDVVHFRCGLDPENVRLGLSPLASAFREIWTDDEAANFSAALLRNFGVPGIMVSPDEDDGVVDEKDLTAVKEYFRSYRGDKRGEPIIMRKRTKVEQFGFSPEQMDVSGLREIPEERVTALLGIPAAVVGFGTGLQQTKVGATMAEMRQMAFENCIMPMQRILGGQIQHQLLPDFEANPSKFRVGYDNRKIRVLQEDRNKLAERLDKGVQGGWIAVDVAQRALGLETQPTDNVYLRKINVIPVPVGVDSTVVYAATGGDEGKRASLHLRNLKSEQWQAVLMTAFERDVDVLSRGWAVELEKAYEDLARAVSKIAAEIIAERYGKGNGNGQTKTEPITDVQGLIASIMTRLRQTRPEFPGVAAQYLRVAQQTVSTVNTVTGLGVMLHDQGEINILRVAKQRELMLLDLEGHVKDSLFTAIAEAREAGEGVDTIARRIRSTVGRGPWTTAKIRAQVTSRTETKFAQNLSSIEVYKGSTDIRAVLAFDAQLGPTDDVCEARDGQTYTFEEAQVQLNEEHPNGTLSFAPVIGRM